MVESSKDILNGEQPQERKSNYGKISTTGSSRLNSRGIASPSATYQGKKRIILQKKKSKLIQWLA